MPTSASTRVTVSCVPCPSAVATATSCTVSCSDQGTNSMRPMRTSRPNASLASFCPWLRNKGGNANHPRAHSTRTASTDQTVRRNHALLFSMSTKPALPQSKGWIAPDFGRKECIKEKARWRAISQPPGLTAGTTAFAIDWRRGRIGVPHQPGGKVLPPGGLPVKRFLGCGARGAHSAEGVASFGKCLEVPGSFTLANLGARLKSHCLWRRPYRLHACSGMTPEKPKFDFLYSIFMQNKYKKHNS